MRITNSTMMSSYLKDMQKNLQNMNKLNTQLNTGKVISKVSDDPYEATKMYNSKNKKVEIGKSKDEITVNNFYNSIIQDLGQSTKAVIKEEANQSKLMTSIDETRASVSGVSLDEEMVNLIQFQHAYNASAKVISTIDSLLDVVINGLVR